MNPQLPTFYAYLAGFIDGEGSFSIFDKSVRVVLSNTDRAVLAEIQAALGGGRLSTRPPRPRTSRSYQLEFGTLALRSLLPELVPFLRVKRRLAELVLEYISGGTFVRGHAPPAEEADRRAGLRQAVGAINRAARWHPPLMWGNDRAR